MPRVSMLPTLFRESFGPRTLPREPEPALIMDAPDQVAAYAEAGRIDGVMSAAYLFHSAKISQVIQGASRVLDLGCGPATQLAQVAELNPDISFLGVDLSREMLTNAEEHTQRLGLSNVDFVQSDITLLSNIDDHSMDAVISTMALHHLPRDELLDACFQQISRVLRPGGAIYLVDFGRLKSLYSVIYFAYQNAKSQPHLFTLDYERSLRAAFMLEQFSAIATKRLHTGVAVYSTFLVPMLVVLKSEDKRLPDGLRGRLRAMSRQLPSKYRKDLNDIRLFFKLDGMRNDPFV